MTIERNLQTSDGTDFGYIVFVDLDHLNSIHDAHQKFQLKTSFPFDWVVTSWTSSKNFITKCVKMEKKISSKLYYRRDYTLLYVTVKIFECNGLKVCRQSEWIAKYFELITRVRHAANSKNDENLSKLIMTNMLSKKFVLLPQIQDSINKVIEKMSSVKSLLYRVSKKAIIWLEKSQTDLFDPPKTRFEAWRNNRRRWRQVADEVNKTGTKTHRSRHRNTLATRF